VMMIAVGGEGHERGCSSQPAQRYTRSQLLLGTLR
jgi:hypothetical protein